MLINVVGSKYKKKSFLFYQFQLRIFTSHTSFRFRDYCERKKKKSKERVPRAYKTNKKLL